MTHWTLPNILTFFRLLAAPAVALVFLALPRPAADWVALALFLIAALSDYLDGWIARTWDQRSPLGAMLDPIADKAIVVIALSVFLGLHGLIFWILVPTIVILWREVIVAGLREFLGGSVATLRVTKLAKWKTAVQMAAIAFMFAWGAVAHTPDDITTASRALYYGAPTLMWAAAALTLVTGYDYMRKAFTYLERAP